MTVLSKQKIIKILEIVDPFLMISKVTILDTGRSGLGEKKIMENSWFYKSHFLKQPIMPGVLQTEAMLQTVVTIFCQNHKINAKDFLINKISSNFFQPISGSGKIIVNGSLEEERNGIVVAKANLFFFEKKASEGTFRFLLPGKLNLNYAQSKI